MQRVIQNKKEDILLSQMWEKFFFPKQIYVFLGRMIDSEEIKKTLKFQKCIPISLETVRGMNVKQL